MELTSPAGASGGAVLCLLDAALGTPCRPASIVRRERYAVRVEMADNGPTQPVRVPAILICHLANHLQRKHKAAPAGEGQGGTWSF